MFKKECTFQAGVTNLGHLPDFDLPEFAFAGRSNVGKSSLINALLGRKKLVRTSKEPGQTKQLNFFNLADTIYLVDMPGYGYAKVSKKERSAWQVLIKNYLSKRPNLKRVFLLLDARHPVKESDFEYMKFLDSCAISYQVVLTKCDLTTNPTDIDLRKYTAAHPEIIQTSSRKGNGIEKLQQVIANL